MAFESFVDAQDFLWEDVVRELRAGRKESHWVWFVFPQIVGLGTSAVSQRFCLRSLAEARAYLEHPLLGARLIEAVGLVLDAAQPAERILGEFDAMKLRSSLTLFLLVEPGNPVLRRALDELFGGERCLRTERIVEEL